MFTTVHVLIPFVLIFAGAEPKPFQAAVDDPLLVPVKPASLEIDSWNEARETLRKRSTDLENAAAGIDRAEGRWRQSLGVLLPNVRFSGTIVYDLLNPDAPLLNASTGGGPRATTPVGFANIALTQTLVDVSQWYGLRSASSAEESAIATRLDVARRLTLGLARALVAVVAAERVAELNRLGLQQALERAALTKRTQELGAATNVDVVRVEQDVEVARGTLIAGDEQLLRTREALGQALGYGHEVGVKRTFALAGLVTETEQMCRRIQWAERPDLLAAQKNLESASDSRRQASAGYLPALGLTSNLFAYTTEPGFGQLATWSIGAVLSLPIWEGGQRAGLVDERAGIERQTKAQLTALERAVEIEVARTRRGVGVADQLVATATAARAKAAELDALTRRSFEVGRGSSLELVQSAAALRQADVALATREYELVQTRLDALLTEASCDL